MSCMGISTTIFTHLYVTTDIFFAILKYIYTSENCKVNHVETTFQLNIHHCKNLNKPLGLENVKKKKTDERLLNKMKSVSSEGRECVRFYALI